MGFPQSYRQPAIGLNHQQVEYYQPSRKMNKFPSVVLRLKNNDSQLYVGEKSIRQCIELSEGSTF